jgi:hypothetical protein
MSSRTRFEPDALERDSKNPDEAADVLAQRFLRSNLRGRDRGQSQGP